MIYCLHEGKREATDGWFVITREYHLAPAQVDLKDTHDSTVEDQKQELVTVFNNNYSPVFRCQFRIRLIKKLRSAEAQRKNLT